MPPRKPSSMNSGDHLMAHQSHTVPPPFPDMGLTENMSATFLSSGNPCLDFFFHVVPDTPPESIKERLKISWSHDPLKTLKLICNLRGVRGTGKSDKEGYYTAALWLHENHPKTLAGNLDTLAKFGYYKDLPEILYRVMNGAEIRIYQKHVRGRTDKKSRSRNSRDVNAISAEEKRRMRAIVPREKRIAENLIKRKAEMEVARKLKHIKISNMAKAASERYEGDHAFKYLHDEISKVFAESLKVDVDALKLGDVKKISLAAKWCPSVDSSYDKNTLLCTSIGKLMFPREADHEALDEDEYVNRVKIRLTKEVLVPLRKALQLPEVYMSAREWSSVPYSRVASVAMKNYTSIFMERDKERFMGYLEDVKVGKATITAGALLPHEIIEKIKGSSDGVAAVLELQWRRMVDDMLKEGKLTNCLAICDVSGSMRGTPMDVSIALGMLVSELSEEPWKNHLITFSSEPVLQIIKPGDLKSRINSISRMHWEMNTNFQKVFKRILEVAVKEKISKDRMVKRLFVFSDMEFDQAATRPWETDYMKIQRRYKKKGYDVPDIVFWNLRNSSSTPVRVTESGVSLVSGFSKNLIKLFLEEGGVLNNSAVEAGATVEAASSVVNPEATMEAAISGEMYQLLVVLD